ncbi:MAG: hypothetical protein NC311_11540 [Muribaculaceae bacterium]|nr:hypothetical protein [Muribaculaceae bacterium]
MNQARLTARLAEARGNRRYRGDLSDHVTLSIEEGRSNYSVTNLMTYCDDIGVRLVMEDMATEDRFYPGSVADIHGTLWLLMERYNVDRQLIYRKTARHYTVPKPQDDKAGRSLSVVTLLAVCEVIHCDLRFEPK